MTRKEQAQASRSALIEAARECFATYGYEATTVAAVLERAGMARGALYHYFPGGKHELFLAVFDLMNEAFHRQRDVLLVIGSPIERIKAGVRLFLELCTQKDFAHVVLLDAPQNIPGQSGRGSTYELLRAQLVEARSAGEIGDVDPEVMASALYGAVRSVAELVVGVPDSEHMVEQALRAIDMLLDGLCVAGQAPAGAAPQTA